MVSENQNRWVAGSIENALKYTHTHTHSKLDLEATNQELLFFLIAHNIEQQIIKTTLSVMKSNCPKYNNFIPQQPR